jgi:radical SAM superfamily enzyme YgiQ (UPF0313 family)
MPMNDESMMSKVILTADRSLMNNFHLKTNLSNAFYGSADIFPNWIYHLLAGRPKKDSNNEIIFAPYPLRKIEGKLIDEGFIVSTISPLDISRHIEHTKILGIHTVDPLGLGTTSYIRNKLIEHEPYSVLYFKRLLKTKTIKEAKKKGLKIIVGGAGAWQIQRNPEIQKKLGIDCVILGEAENVILKVAKQAMKNEKLPQYVQSEKKDVPDINEISSIKRASNSGCIEIGRGCVRGCKFCDVTKNKLRWIPHNMIENELKVNTQSGLNHGILHAEDVLLYGQNSVIPDCEKLIKLIKMVKKYYKKINFTHISLAAVSAEPKAIPVCMELLLQDQDFALANSGIETGSVRLLTKSMSGKMKPFEKENWPEIIHNSLGILHDNSFIPYLSLICGLPGENEDDILKTLELIDDLKDYRCLLLPGNFTPLGAYENNKGLSHDINEINELNRQILKKSINHDLYWINDLRYDFLKDSNFKTLLHLLTIILMKQYKFRTREINILS